MGIVSRLYYTGSGRNRDKFCLVDEQGFLVADLLNERNARAIVRAWNEVIKTQSIFEE